MIDGIDWIGAVVARRGDRLRLGEVGRLPGRDERAAARRGSWPGSRRSAAAASRRTTSASSRPTRSRPRCGSRACSAAPTRRTARASTRRGSPAGSRSRASGAASSSTSAPRRRRSRPGASPARRGGLAAEIVVRATEAFTTRLPGESRSYLPLASHMLATEPLPAEAWDEIGWAGCAPIADQRYQFAYAQRTPDGRIALGGRGLTYRLGGPIRESDEVQPGIHGELEATLRRLFPAAAAVPVSHRWGCFFAAPRDWSMGARFDPGVGPRQCRRLLGSWGRRVEPRGTHPRRPHHRDGERPHRPAVGRPREQTLGARAAPLHRSTDHRGRRGERRRGRRPDGPPGPADRARAALAAGPVVSARLRWAKRFRHLAAHLRKPPSPPPTASPELDVGARSAPVARTTG